MPNFLWGGWESHGGRTNAVGWPAGFPSRRPVGRRSSGELRNLVPDPIHLAGDLEYGHLVVDRDVGAVREALTCDRNLDCAVDSALFHQ